MSKKILFIILLALIVVSPVLGRADYSNSVTYLQSQTQDVWITQALVAANVSNPDISYVDAASDDLMIAAKNVLALSATGHTSSSNYGVLIDTIESSFDNSQFGSLDLLNDDFWALLALSSVGNDDYDQAVKNLLLSHQNDDGGWSWSVTGQSDSNDTAAGIMTLLDAGLSASSDEIADALGYLQTTQNDDGGFGYDTESESDGASTAWIIAALNKAEVDPNTWLKGDNDPVSFLQSLEQSDGSFLWMTSDSQGSVMVTAYALLALSGSTYPVNYVELTEPPQQSTGLSLRIEGPDSTICQANNLSANTALDLLAAGAEACDFEYTAQDSAYGVYVSAIDGVEAEGMEGWQYWVDWQPAMVGVADYQLSGNEFVLWAYGGWPLYSTKLEVSDENISAGDSILITATYYDGENWQPWTQAPIYVSEDLYQTDGSGQVNLTLENDGVYPVWVEQRESYVRSNKVYVKVGNGTSQSVDLSVNIESGGGSGGDTVAFSVSQSNINFGDLRPGQSAETIITVANTGNLPVYVEASVMGSDVFVDNTVLNQSTWDSFNLSLPIADSSSVNVGLSVPSDWDTIGNQSGQLIFWGAGQQ